MSGVNDAIGAFKKADMLIGTDPQALLAWMDNHCRSNPLEKIKAAADVLISELLRKSNIK